MKKDILMTIGTVVIALILVFLIVTGLVYLVCRASGGTFTWDIAFRVYLMTTLLYFSINLLINNRKN